MSESDASQTETEIALDVEQRSDSEMDFVVETTEDFDEAKTSEVKLTIEQETEDADLVVSFQEEDKESTREGLYLMILCFA